MALTANDIVIFVSPNGGYTTEYRKGNVIVSGANPEIAWYAAVSGGANGRIVYTGIAAPAGVVRTAPALAADNTTWLNQLVEPTTGFPNPSGRARGVVVEVLLTGDPPAALTLVVKTAQGFYLLPAANARIVA